MASALLIPRAFGYKYATRQSAQEWWAMGRAWMQVCIAAAAVLAAGVLVHWVAHQPALAAGPALHGPYFVEILLRSPPDRQPLPDWFRYGNLAVIAFLGLSSAALALFILWKSRPSAATVQLAGALALAPLSAVAFYFLWTHPAYRQALALDHSAGLRHVFLFVAYASGLTSACFLVRFFIAYPRRPSDDEVLAFRRRLVAEKLAAARSGWRGRLHRPLQRWLEGIATRRPRLRGILEGGSPVRSEMALWRFFASGWALVAALALSILSVVGEGYAAVLGVQATSKGAAVLLKLVPWMLNLMFLVTAISAALQALHYHHREAIADDRARIDWIYGTVLVVGILAIAAVPASWAIIAPVLSSLPAGAIPADLLFIGPAALAFELFLVAFVASLALSVFYRGAVDPRLALRRLSVFGVMGLVIAVLFVILERAVAIKVAAWLGLPQETGAVMAAAVVAGTLAPVRGHAEKAVTKLVTGFLPLEALIEGERRTLAVVLSDLSGYTALSARDERQAMLAAALLQRLAAQAAERFQGRVVKSMGDAVIVVFESAGSAGRALAAMHEGFAPGAAALGLPALPLHSGAHYGEVTQTHDGDIYGQTVNIAARLQALAADGQRVVSAEFARAAALPEPSVRALGPKRLKNVPEPVECLELG